MSERVPELRQVYLSLLDGMLSWTLKCLTDVYRYGQLEKITIHDHSAYSVNNTQLVPASKLYEWLLMSRVKHCVFQLDFMLTDDKMVIDPIIKNYLTVFNARLEQTQYNQFIDQNIHVRYPTLYQDRKNDDDNLCDIKTVSRFFT